MPVPFIERLLLNRPNASVSPQTIAQIIGSVVVTRKMSRRAAREGQSGAAETCHRQCTGLIVSSS
jgi:hypothetical protein